MRLRDMNGYMGRILRVDLSNELIKEEYLGEAILRQYIGGVGFGARVLYDEVPPGVEWSDPENRLILATGPLNGTKVAGAGTFCSVTKGCLTNGGASSQANGYFGTYLKFSGFDAIIIHGAAKKWLYLYVHDGIAELRDAAHLMGRDTIETQHLVEAELGKKEREVSIYCIGLSGENLVRFAAIMGDRSHFLAHNGVGAVMGSKKLKAFVAARGRMMPIVKDPQILSRLNKEMVTKAKVHPVYGQIDKWGTSMLFGSLPKVGLVPAKNLTTNIYPDLTKFLREHYDSRFELKRNPCWACPLHHSQFIKVTEGPYAGLETKDPEYECAAEWGPLIGNNDFGAAVMLCDVTDRLGLDCNEAGWTIALVIECFEKGIITKKDTDGLEMSWGNVEAVRAMLHKIAKREGWGNILAEGVMRTAQHIGGEAINLGVYVKRGHAPRGHDARARWSDILDYATGGVSTSESNSGPVQNPFSSEGAAEVVYKGKIREFVDSLVVCDIATMTYSSYDVGHLIDMLNAVTGWDFTVEEAIEMSMRVANLFRVFNIRHGFTPEMEEPSPRYGSAPVDGPVKGKSVMPHWKKMLDEYYECMGWDRTSGKPLPDTLKSLGLEAVIDDIWHEQDSLNNLRRE